MGISIAIEGPEGAGKSLLFSLSKILIEKAINQPLLATREPGGTRLGEKIREILKDERFKEMHPIANVLLYSTPRAELFYMREKPFLDANPLGILLKDRSWLSTLSLQSVDGADIEYIKDVQAPFMGIPDKFVIIDVPVIETVVRMLAAEKNGVNREIDWRDKQTDEILTNVRNNYLEYAKKNRDRCLVFDCFDDPWNKAARIGLEAHKFVAGRKGKYTDHETDVIILDKLTRLAKEIHDTDTFFDSHIKADVRTFDIEELRSQVEETRIELGYPSKEELQAKMHEEWRMLGLEGAPSGIERGK